MSNIKEEYFSDLNADDIPDDEVSDVDENEIDVDKLQEDLRQSTMKSKIKVQEDIIDKYSEANLIFMTELIKLF